ncbi:MAG TPA: CHRD domain-containing protein [Burkholderiaceae bacterium]
MITRTHALRTLFATALLAVLAGCIVIPFSSRATFDVALSADQEVPPVMATGSGRLEGSYDKITRVFTWKLSYAGLSGQPTAAHFHGPARAGANAGIALGLANPVTNPSQGQATLTTEQGSELMAGQWYINVHTAINPGGEVRGQLVAR